MIVRENNFSVFFSLLQNLQLQLLLFFCSWSSADVMDVMYHISRSRLLFSWYDSSKTTMMMMILPGLHLVFCISSRLFFCVTSQNILCSTRYKSIFYEYSFTTTYITIVWYFDKQKIENLLFRFERWRWNSILDIITCYIIENIGTNKVFFVCGTQKNERQSVAFKIVFGTMTEHGIRFPNKFAGELKYCFHWTNTNRLYTTLISKRSKRYIAFIIINRYNQFLHL